MALFWLNKVMTLGFTSLQTVKNGSPDFDQVTNSMEQSPVQISALAASGYKERHLQLHSGIRRQTGWIGSWSLPTPQVKSIQFVGDRFFAKADPILQSFDGVNFIPADGWPRFDSIAYNHGIWVAIDSSSMPGAPPPGTISVSTNGASWSTVNVTGQGNYQIQLYTAGERFILTAGSNYFFESTDALSGLLTK